MEFHRNHDAGAKLRELMRAAIASHQLGQLAEAERLYQAVLKTDPKHFDALHLLGALEIQRGFCEKGVRLIDRALKVNPRFALAWFNRGNGLKELGRYDEAIASYARATELKRDYAEAYNNWGSVLLDLGRAHEALTRIDAAIASAPHFGQALSNRCAALCKLDRLADALLAADQAIAIQPDYAEGHYHRGVVLARAERFEAALESYDKAIALRADYAQALNTRGAALVDLYRLEEALASFDAVIALEPVNAEAFHNRGTVLLDLKRHEDALQSFKKALAIAPGHRKALYNCAVTLRALQRYPEATATLTKLLQLDPDDALAAALRFECKAWCCDWSKLASEREDLAARVRAGQTVLPFVVLSALDSPELQYAAAKTWSEQKHPARSLQGNAGGEPHERIRVAYVSADFHEHATAYLMAELFEQHDREGFECFAISYGRPDTSPMRKRLQAAFDRFLDLERQPERNIAQTMRSLGIDIAIDLKGFTADHRTDIFAYRCAPIQVNYLGYPGTMGASYIDYIIADAHVIPLDACECFSEKVVYLPDCYQVNDSKRAIGELRPSRQELGLPERGFVFCSFNATYKITPELFDVWMRLLRQVEGSVLWLYADQDAAVNALRKETQARGVSGVRLIPARHLPLDQHLRRLTRADLCLDTLIVNGHTTASDALRAGVPLITCRGKSFAARVAGSLLHAVGLPELVTSSLADYEKAALDFAMHPARLAAVREKLNRQRASSPLFDTDRYRRHLESAYLTMWKRHQRGEPPESFAV
jgi:predicted O-linked N-acetylglucosamine transferase (SPINDLY family)